MSEQTKSSKNKKALLEELKGNKPSTESKRTRGPVQIGPGSLIGSEKRNEGTSSQEVLVDFIYKVDHEKNEVSFYDKVEGDEVDLFWDFGNGKTFEGRSPEKVSFSEPGRYTATLTDRISGTTKEKTFAIKHDSNENETGDKLKADKVKSSYTGGLESFLENARREEFDFGVNNVRLSKNIHGVLSKICVNKVTITNLTNYIISNFIDENREEIRKYIERNNKFDF